jgi:membrane protease subunit HflK
MIRAFAILAVLATAGYFATGFAVVSQDEVGVVRRFGAVQKETWSPGLHWGLPWGLGQVDRVKLGQTRTLTIGARDTTASPLTRAPDPRDDFLTGDLNLVTVQALIQYRVADPGRFLFTAANLDQALTLAAESALTRALAERGIDDVLTTGRAEVADQLARVIQQQADQNGLGVSIRAVRLGRVAPPVPVAPAFADAARARSDRRQVVTGAEEYRDRVLAEARGQAREITDRAAAEHDRRIQVAQGEADRFARVLAEARKAPDATRRRLYLEAITELLPRFSRKVIVEPGRELDLGLIADETADDGNSP